MKKKLGPLPLWSWVLIVGGTIGLFLLYRSKSSSSTSAVSTAQTVDPNNPLGLTYAQEQADVAEGVDPNTGETYASEQASSQTGDTSGGTGSSYSSDSAELATIDADLGVVSSQLNTLSSGTTDTTSPGQTFGGEISDIVGGITALRAAGLIPALPVPPTKTKQPSLTVKGAIRARSGATRPPAKKGYTIKGLGNGNWEYVPVIKKTTTKTKTRTPTKTTKPPKKTIVSGGKRR